MNEIKTATVINGCNHHLSVRSVRSLIAARVEEKTPVATQRLLEGNGRN
jgi:hypothetical protein